MKIKLKQKHLPKIFLGLIIFSVITFLIVFLVITNRPYHSVKTDEGNIYSFRENVKVANRTLVYPDEDTLRERFLNTNLTDLTFVFVPTDTKTNGYYSIWAIEFGFKLTQFYNSIGYVTGEANIAAQPVDSINNITNNPQDLKIIIIPYNESEGNKIVVDENRIYLHGRNSKEMDYAVMKTILVAIGNWTLAS